MPENLSKKVTIRFEGQTGQLKKETAVAIAQLKAVGIEAKKVSQVGKDGRTRTTIQGTAQGSSGDVHDRTARALKKLQGEIKETTGLTRGYTVAYDKATKATNKFNRSARETSKALGETHLKHRLTIGHVLKYTGAYTAASAAMATFVAGAASIPQIGMDLQATTAVMSASFGGVEQAGKQLDFIDKLADEAAVSIGDLQTSYRKFSASTKLVGVSTGETQAIFRSMTKVMRSIGASADETAGTFTALTQIFNKNKVMAEELQNQLGERVPGAVAAFADSMGMNVEQLNKEMEQGFVRPQYYILKFAKFLEEKFGVAFDQAMENLSAKLTAAGNAWTRFAQDAFAASEKGMSSIVEWATAAINFARENLPAIGTAIKVLTAIIAGSFIAQVIHATAKTWGWVTANIALARSFNAVTTASSLSGFKTALGSIKGVTGEIKKSSFFVQKFSKILSKIPNPFSKLAAAAITVGLFALDLKSATKATVTYGDETVKVTSIIKSLWKNTIGGLASDWAGMIKNYTDTVGIMYQILEERSKSAAEKLAPFMKSATKGIVDVGLASVGISHGWETVGSAVDSVLTKIIGDAKKLEEAENAETARLRKIKLAKEDEAAAAQEAADEKILEAARLQKLEEEKEDQRKKAQAAAEAASAKIQKNFETELSLLAMQLVQLTASEDQYNRIAAAAKGYNIEEQNLIVTLKQQIREAEAANEATKAAKQAYAESKKSVAEYRAELEKAQAIGRALAAGGTRLSIADAEELAEVNKEVSKFPKELQETIRQILLAESAQRKYNSQMYTGLDILERQREELAKLSDPDSELTFKLRAVDPSQQSEITKNYYALQLASLEESLKTEEEAIEESYRRRTEMILFNTEDGSQKQLELLARLNKEKLNQQYEEQKQEQNKILEGVNDVFSGINALNEASAGQSESAQKRMLAVQRGIAITQAIINTFSAAIHAMTDPKSPDPAAKFANYAAVVGAGLSAVAAIRGASANSTSSSVDGGAFATGGSFIVPGSGGTDTKSVHLTASPGERVTVETPEQQNRGTAIVNMETKINVVNNTFSQVTASERIDGKQQIIDIMIEDVQNDGQFSQAHQEHFGLTRSAM